MGANLAANVNKALDGWMISGNYCWTDSTIALCWINQPFRNWKTFVSNRTQKIFDITGNLNLKWRHVPTDMNDADHGSRGASIDKLEKIGWWKGADWLLDQSKWPEESEEFKDGIEMAQEELKKNSDLVLMALDKKCEEWEMMLQRSTLKKAKRVTAWCLRFCKNALLSAQGKLRKSGPLKTDELNEANSYWIR